MIILYRIMMKHFRIYGGLLGDEANEVAEVCIGDILG